MFKWRYLRDKIFAFLVISISIAAFAPLFHILYTVFTEGFNTILKAGIEFLFKTPPSPLSNQLGGIAPALVGSILMTAVSTPLTVCVALLASIMSNEFPRNIVSRALDTLSRSLASIPTIIVSMTVYILIVVPSKSFSLFAGALALTIIALPYAYTSFTSAFRSVPMTYREASYSIGISKWKTVTMVLIPIAKRAFLAGLLITFARTMGETAALLFVVGRSRSVVNYDIFKPGDALPLLIFDFISTPYKAYHEIAWGATLILLLMYLVVFTAAKLLVKEVRL